VRDLLCELDVDGIENIKSASEVVKSLKFLKDFKFIDTEY
jgi:hypothetical protein